MEEPAAAVLVIVTLCAGLAVPWPCAANARPSVGRETTGGAKIPDPVSGRTSGLVAPSLGTISDVAAAGPVAEGV